MARKRKPVFVLKPAQVILRCRKLGHCDMCAGHVLALMALMEHFGRNISQLADHSHVGRATISEILSLNKCPTTDTRHTLAETFGSDLLGFEMLSRFCFLGEVSP